MTITKAINLQNQARDITVSVFSEAERYGHTHDQILDNLNSRLAKIRAEKLPRWIRSSIFEVSDALFKNLYAGPSPRVVWMHVVDGVKYADWNSLPEKGKQLARENKLVSGHFWTGTGKPFSMASA